MAGRHKLGRPHQKWGISKSSRKTSVWSGCSHFIVDLAKKITKVETRSDGEDVVVDATPPADAPEAAVAGPVPAESVASDSESSGSSYSMSEAPHDE